MTKKIVRILSTICMVSGFLILLYVALPFLRWYLIDQPSLQSQTVTSPIPELVTDVASIPTKTPNSEDAKEWFPTQSENTKLLIPKVSSYTISIPKLHIKNARVATASYDLSKQLVHYPGTPLAPDIGTGVIFGHSSLPEFFSTKNYKSIFTYLPQLKKGDEILVQFPKITYRYVVENATIVKPTDFSVFAQNKNGSFLTLVTCVPPGTTWKRLLIRAKLAKL